jgi:hypothetical protein
VRLILVATHILVQLPGYYRATQIFWEKQRAGSHFEKSAVACIPAMEKRTAEKSDKKIQCVWVGLCVFAPRIRKKSETKRALGEPTNQDSK